MAFRSQRSEETWATWASGTGTGMGMETVMGPGTGAGTGMGMGLEDGGENEMQEMGLEDGGENEIQEKNTWMVVFMPASMTSMPCGEKCMSCRKLVVVSPAAKRGSPITHAK